MTIAEMEAKAKKEFAGVFNMLGSQLCPKCNKPHGLTPLEHQIIVTALTSAYLSGVIETQRKLTR